jgi:hypothetical protein
VTNARDCGAHIVMAKPLTPKAVLDRIVWVARTGRRFVESDKFVGPDRRFKEGGVPEKVGAGRRREDAVQGKG